MRLNPRRVDRGLSLGDGDPQLALIGGRTLELRALRRGCFLELADFTLQPQQMCGRLVLGAADYGAIGQPRKPRR